MKNNKIKTKLEPILEYLTLSAISENYFGKSRQYLYHKLNNTIINGVKYKFNDNELDILIDSLENISLILNQSIAELKTIRKNKIKKRGKFYTECNPFNHSLFLDWLTNIPNYQERRFIEPFAGTNNIVKQIKEIDSNIINWTCYDISPPKENNMHEYKVTKRDTIKKFPKGFNVCVTNPPYLSKSSAARNKLKYPDTQYDDLYKYCLDIMLSNCEYVAVILPESFITANIFHNRIYGVVSLNNKLFDDTHCPVCLALFTPQKRSSPFVMYLGHDYLGKYDELKRYDLSEYIDGNNWAFNDPNGEIGIKCVDNHKGADIYFHRGELISSDKIKVSSRTFTRISGLPTTIDRDVFIECCNKVLKGYRAQTQDVFLTSFKGLRKDGKYRRRIDFKTIRTIMNKSLKLIS